MRFNLGQLNAYKLMCSMKFSMEKQINFFWIAGFFLPVINATVFSIQKQFLIKSRLWWRVYGNSNSISFTLWTKIKQHQMTWKWYLLNVLVVVFFRKRKRPCCRLFFQVKKQFWSLGLIFFYWDTNFMYGKLHVNAKMVIFLDKNVMVCFE